MATLMIMSARAENEVLKERVKYLEGRCQVLTLENESLKAEVELYRQDAVAATAAVDGMYESLQGTESLPTSYNSTPRQNDDNEHFVKGGDGVYTKSPEILLESLHSCFNILCCSLSNDDSILATGGADRCVTLCEWGQGFGNADATVTASTSTLEQVVQSAIRIHCEAPVIALDFARNKGHSTQFLAAGCMDGSVHVIFYDKMDDDSGSCCNLKAIPVAQGSNIHHNKYVRTVVWSPNDTILASASADGSIHIHKLNWNLFDPSSVTMEKTQTLQLSGPVESMCFLPNDHLCCYTRGTPYLIYFDLNNNFSQTKINLNHHNQQQGPGSHAGFDDHVSFAVMDMAPYGDTYLALATDTSRNIILDWKTGTHIRNLYGHTNDGFSQPKLAWSQNGQYLYGNSQDDPVICVWDIATSTMVDRLQGPHSNAVRDMFSSQLTNTLVTTSYDKKTQLWLAPVVD
jgi:WD40 repeat protein